MRRIIQRKIWLICAKVRLSLVVYGGFEEREESTDGFFEVEDK